MPLLQHRKEPDTTFFDLGRVPHHLDATRDCE